MTDQNLKYDGYQWNLAPGLPGPRGPAGQQGVQGIPGVNGTDGAPGTPGSSIVASTQPIPSVTSEPGWYVIGALYVASDLSNVQLEVIGGISDSSVTLTTRLFSLSTVAEVSGSRVNITSIPDVRVISSTIATLPGTTTYQVQAQALSASPGDGIFAVVKSAKIIPG